MPIIYDVYDNGEQLLNYFLFVLTIISLHIL